MGEIKKSFSEIKSGKAIMGVWLASILIGFIFFLIILIT